ncbi:MAG: hypothetical protein ABIY48_02040 [Acidimicrobiales bacterium]
MTALVPDDSLETDMPAAAHERLTSRLRLYIASALVVVAVGVAALLAPRFFGAADEPKSSGKDGFAFHDDFERTAPAGLGQASGQEWEAVSGSFGTAGGAAVLQTPNEVGPRSITLVDVGATNGRIVATVGRATSSWGVAFRYADPFNYWYLQAAPDYAVLNVVRVMGGNPQVIGPTNLVGLREGTEVEVLLHGSDIKVQVDGTTVFFLTNNHALGAHKAGLLALGDADGTSWAEFSATPDEADPGPTDVVGAAGPAAP